MKRSEMIDILMDAINKFQYQDYKFDEETTEQILERIEEIGMLPPTITILENHYNRAEGEMGFYSNEWEQE